DISARKSPALNSGVCSLEVNNSEGVPRTHSVVLEIQRGSQPFARPVRPSTEQKSQVQILPDAGKMPDPANSRPDPTREWEHRKRAPADRRFPAFHARTRKPLPYNFEALRRRSLPHSTHNESQNR